ncbi:MAG TPA: hypothetical protein VME46_17540, partial [Acidimicrobiales bacterium]|nr:hypothetical protein [Acidimicrobiales bacterium]
MHRFPPYHIPRQRLVGPCLERDVVVVEAAGGYGKTVFAVELVDAWRAVGIEVDLGFGPTTARLFIARLREAVVRAGYNDALSAADVSDDVAGALEVVTRSLVGERCSFVVDDAHNALPDAAALLQHFPGRLAEGQRLVVLARRLPPGAGRLRRAEYFSIGPADLAMNGEETLRLCRSGFGLDVTSEAAQILEKLTGGWTAASVLAAARAKRTGEPLTSLSLASAGEAYPGDVVSALLEEATSSLGRSDRHLLAQVARLRLVDPELVEKATGKRGLFSAALRAGIPFTPAHGSWWELPGPVREHLSTLAPADPQSLRLAAREYQRRGQVGWALQMLLVAGDASEAAALLATTPPEVLEQVDGPELHVFLDQLPPDAIAAYPYVLVVVGRSLRLANRFDQGVALLERARDWALETGDAPLGRAAAAELAAELVRRLERDEAEAQARGVLASAGPSEQLTRARSYHVLGQALCWKLGPTGQRDAAALDEAEACFAWATDLYKSLGMLSAVSGLAPYWAISIEFARGHSHAALRRLEEALTLAGNRPRRYAHVLSFRAWVAAELGQDELCRASAEEVLRIAAQLNSDLFRSQGHWRLAILSSYRGDAEATLRHLRQVELHRGNWWLSASGDFLADAIDLCDRVGLTEAAREYLERAKAEPKDAAHLVALSEAAMCARHGDPAVAERLLLATEKLRIDPREYWRVTLLRAYAALRGGDQQAAGLLAARALDEAARIGQPELPWVREQALAEQLLDVAIRTGAPAAMAARTTSRHTLLTVLGRFELTVDGRPVQFGTGREGRLLRMVAVSGNGVHAEQAIEMLWPEVSPGAGRNRLRTVLGRLRSSAGEVVVRKGDLLVLNEAVALDYRDLLAQASQAEQLARTDVIAAASVARAVLTRFEGELLPDDIYEDWAELPR